MNRTKTHIVQGPRALTALTCHFVLLVSSGCDDSNPSGGDDVDGDSSDADSQGQSDSDLPAEVTATPAMCATADNEVDCAGFATNPIDEGMCTWVEVTRIDDACTVVGRSPSCLYFGGVTTDRKGVECTTDGDLEGRFVRSASGTMLDVVVDDRFVNRRPQPFEGEGDPGGLTQWRECGLDSALCTCICGL